MSTLCHPYVNPTSTLCHPYVDPMSSLRRSYVDPMSSLRQPYVDPMSSLRRPYVDPTSSLRQCTYKTHIQKKSSAPPLHFDIYKIVPTSILCRPYVNPTSTLCHPYVDPTLILRRPYVIPTSTLCRPYVIPTSTLRQCTYKTHIQKKIRQHPPLHFDIYKILKSKERSHFYIFFTTNTLPCLQKSR